MAKNRAKIITALALTGIAAHLILRFGFHLSATGANLPLWIVLGAGGAPLVLSLILEMFRGEFGSDLLAAFSIITAVLLGQYLAGSLVVLMLSGGELLENYAIANASSVLRALAKRMPSIAHRNDGNAISDISIDSITPGD